MPAAVIRTQKVHPALCIPELVSQILEHLVDLEDASDVIYGRVPSFLLVNRLWHECGASIAWRSFVFENPYEDFVRFSKVFGDANNSSSRPQKPSKKETHPSHQRTTDLVRLSVFNYLFPHSSNNNNNSNKSLLPQQQPPQKPSNLLVRYRQLLRSLTLHKLKDEGLSTHLEQIGYYASRLERLELYICDHLQDRALILFALHGQLTHLSLAGCHRITDEAVLKVAERCPRLEHLDVRACGNISDTSISAVAHHCRLLKHLNVGRVRDRERITAKSILLVAKYTQVVVLGLAGCDIDDACMLEVVRQRGGSLERVSLNSCPRISNVTLRACAAYCFNLSVLELKKCQQIDDWELVYLLQYRRKVLLTMCDQQARLSQAWTERHLQQHQEDESSRISNIAII